MKKIWESKLQYNNSQDANSIVSPPSKTKQNKNTTYWGVGIVAYQEPDKGKKGTGYREAVFTCQHINSTLQPKPPINNSIWKTSQAIIIS